MILSEAITTEALPWSAVDEETLNHFLNTETGKRFLPKLLEQSVPPLLAGGHVNAILIRSGEVRGATNLVQAIIALSHAAPLPQQYQNEYPAPENDAAWADGQKIEIPQPPQE